MVTYDAIAPNKRLLSCSSSAGSQLIDATKDVIAEIFCDVEHLLY